MFERIREWREVESGTEEIYAWPTFSWHALVGSGQSEYGSALRYSGIGTRALRSAPRCIFGYQENDRKVALTTI